MNPGWTAMIIVCIAILIALVIIFTSPTQQQQDNAVVKAFPGSIIYKVESQRYIAIDTTGPQPWAIYIEAGAISDSSVTSVKVGVPVKISSWTNPGVEKITAFFRGFRLTFDGWVRILTLPETGSQRYVRCHCRLPAQSFPVHYKIRIFLANVKLITDLKLLLFHSIFYQHHWCDLE